MRLVLDSGAVRAMAKDRSLLARLHARSLWPPLVPVVVLVECLTGDHRRDHAVNRVLRTCELVDVDELLAREAARLRQATGRAGSIAVTDALVVGVAAAVSDGAVVTGDLADMRELAQQAKTPVTVVGPD